MIYIADLKMTDAISDYLKAHEVGKSFIGMEYRTLKATIIASLFGTVTYKSELFLYGMRLFDLADFN